MPNNITIIGNIVKEYLLKYPSISSYNLSKLLLKDIPDLFNDLEKTRSVIRYYRGANGSFNRKSINADSYIPKISIPYQDEEEYLPYVINFCSDIFPIMIGADAHIPFHDQDALEIFIERSIEIKAKTIILNGDWIDFYMISNWMKDPRKRSTKEEIALFNSILDMIQDNTKAKIIYKYGNHEERFDNYLMQNAPQLFELEEMHLDNILKLSERNIDVIKDKRVLKVDHLHIIHGHEYKFAISNPVNPARGLYLKAKKNAVCGHFHQTSEHTESAINGDIVTDWSIGCLCSLHPQYMPLNRWNHGFAEIYYDDTFFNLRNRKIINYRLV
jgi:hypothetical protein